MGDYKSYVLFLNSGDDTNRVGNAQESTYTVRWDAVIPPQFHRRKFFVKFSFASSASATIQSEPYLIYADFGAARSTYNQSGTTSAFLGIIPFQNMFQEENEVVSTWSVGCEFNPKICIGYPSNNFVKITLQDQSAPFNIQLTSYCLAMHFELVDE